MYHKIVFFIAALILPSLAQTGSYTIEEGGYRKVCRAVAENLNRDPRWSPCNRSLSDDKGIITRPEWIVHDPDESILEIKKFYQLLYGQKRWRGEQRFFEFMESSKTFNHVGLRTTTVDIDNDGVMESVAQYRYGKCEHTRVYGTAFAVFDQDLSEVKIDITSALTLGDYSYSEDYGANWHYYTHNVFLMNGVAYIDKYYALNRFAIDIHKLSNAKSQRVCRIAYTKEN